MSVHILAIMQRVATIISFPATGVTTTSMCKPRDVLRRIVKAIAAMPATLLITAITAMELASIIPTMASRAIAVAKTEVDQDATTGKFRGK